MSNETSNKCSALKVERLINELMEDGHNPAEISFTLAQYATALGLEMAPDPQRALIVVMNGFQAACANTIEEDEGCDCDEEPDETVPLGTTVH